MSSTSPRNAPPSGLSLRVYRAAVLRQLAKLRRGYLTLIDQGQVHHFGNSHDALRATVVVQHPRFYRRLAWGGGLGAAESLLDGDWHCEDQTALVRLFIRNMDLADSMDGGLAWLRQGVALATHWWRANTPAGSRRNIHAHYDLGNDFYSLFLDNTLSYSCGIFERPDATMHEASLAKMERVCRKLDLQPHDHLLEIGTGWGALAIHAARHFGCRVTTTTISDEQFRHARQRVRDEGLEGQITVLCQDYRALQGQFDKLVSIEMIEAVGHEFFPVFFRQCADRLKPDGAMLVQSIVIVDDRYRLHLKYVDFIRQYVFPGGCLPSISVLTDVAAAAGGLRLLQLEDIGPHYAATLRHWRRAFLSRLDDVRALGFDERFIRMWTYYLCYCEAAFEERQVNDVQMLFAKRACRLDPLQALGSPHSSIRTRPAGEPDAGEPDMGEPDTGEPDSMAFSGTRAPVDSPSIASGLPAERPWEAVP